MARACKYVDYHQLSASPTNRRLILPIGSVSASVALTAAAAYFEYSSAQGYRVFSNGEGLG